jgi:hypothetical protein
MDEIYLYCPRLGLADRSLAANALLREEPDDEDENDEDEDEEQEDDDGDEGYSE